MAGYALKLARLADVEALPQGLAFDRWQRQCNGRTAGLPDLHSPIACKF